MNPTRILSCTLCLGVACVLLTGNAVAGTTTAVEITYAREVGTTNAIYTLPTNSITRAMNVVRDQNQDFFLRVSPGLGSQFATDRLPAPGDLALTTAGGCAIAAPIIVAGGTDGDTFINYFVDITTDCTSFPTFTLTTTGWTIRDVNNTLGNGDTITVTLETRDSATNITFDSGGAADTDNWLNSGFGVAVPFALNATTAVIDALNNPSQFVATPPDTTTQDNGATIGFDSSVAGTLNLAGDPYTLVAADSIQLTVTGDLSGIASITWDPGGAAIVDAVTAGEVTAGTTTLSLPGGSSSLDGSANGIRITVDGTTILSERTLTMTVNLTLSGGAGGPAANSRTLFATSTLTLWSLNGTVLIANFVNGNTAIFSSRVYLFNTSSTGGNITVRVFTLPVSGGSILLGTVDLGILSPSSARNIRLGEDILVPLGIALPYTNDGGDLTLELTITGADVGGVGQVFSSSLGLGTYPLQEIPAISAGSPTVLVANFMNGNNDAFNSRVYLWNPSASDGDVTVRVFTLPLTGGLPQELTVTPLSLGSLEALSAMKIRLALDILTPLGIPLPYLTDGGNLVLEFTIQAADVRGATQVF